MKTRTPSTPVGKHHAATSTRRPHSAAARPAGVVNPEANGAGSAPFSAEPSAALHPYIVRIGYFNPEAREVSVAGTFNDWEPHETPLTRDSLGDWSVEISLPPGEHRYRLIVDGEWCDDPMAQRMEPNPYGTFDSIILV